MSVTNFGQTCQRFSFVLVTAGGRGCDRLGTGHWDMRNKVSKGRGFKKFQRLEAHHPFKKFFKRVAIERVKTRIKNVVCDATNLDIVNNGTNINSTASIKIFFSICSSVLFCLFL